MTKDDFNVRYRKFKESLIFLINSSEMPLACVEDALFIVMAQVRQKLDELDNVRQESESEETH